MLGSSKHKGRGRALRGEIQKERKARTRSSGGHKSEVSKGRRALKWAWGQMRGCSCSIKKRGRFHKEFVSTLYLLTLNILTTCGQNVCACEHARAGEEHDGRKTRVESREGEGGRNCKRQKEEKKNGLVAQGIRRAGLSSHLCPCLCA